MDVLSLIVSAVSALLLVARFVHTVIKNNLQRRCEAPAYAADTASTLRGTNTRLTWYEWYAACALEREGCGRIRNGRFEMIVNTIPPALQQAMAARALHASRSWG